MSGVSAVGRRLRAAWRVIAGTGAAASVGLGLLVFACVLVAVAAPRQSLELRTKALRHTLAGVPPLTSAVVGTIGYGDFSIGLNGNVRPSDLAAARAKLGANLAHHRLPMSPPASDWFGLVTRPATVSGVARSAYNGGWSPVMELTYREALGGHAKLIEGRLPASARRGRAGTVIEIAVTPATAARFGLRPGSRFHQGGNTLAVTGIVAPTARRSAFWSYNPVAAAPVLLDGGSPQFPIKYWAGAAFIGPGEVLPLGRIFDVTTIQLSWYFPIDLGRVNAGQVASLSSHLTAAVTQAGSLAIGPTQQPTAVSLTSGLSPVVAAFGDEDQAIASVMGLLAISLAVIGAVLVLLAARLLAERRRGEFAVMRARGASRRQAALLSLRAGAVVTAPAAAAGAVAAIALTPGYSAPLGWWLAGATVAVALAAPALIAARGRAAGAIGGRRAGQAARRGAVLRRLVTEATLVAASVGGLAVLRSQGLSGGGSDLYTSAVPVLVAIPVAVAVMRCYPLVARLLLRLAGRRPGVAAFVALARAVRSPVSAFLPAFALVLTLAVVAFGAMINAAVLRAQTAASWQRTGADAVVDASVTSQPLTPAVQRQIARRADAAAAAGVIPLIGTTATNLTVTVAAMDPARYAAVTAASTLPPFPAARLARPPRPGAPVPVLASAVAAARLGAGATDLSLGTSKITVRVVGSTADIPGVAAGAFVVLPSWALGPHPRPPARLLLGGPHLDAPALLTAVRRAVPGASVTFRSQVLARLAGAPLPQGASRAFALGVFTAAGFSLLIVLISLLLTARTRELTLARLLVMGVTRGQARWIAIAEMLPQLIASAAGGAVAAWVLTVLAGPAIDLTAFSGTVASAPITLQPGPLAIAVAALVSLALAALIAQVALADRGGANRALRMVAE